MNIFKQFIKSLYSPKDISSFRNQGIGKTILYIFFISILTILPLFISFVQTVNNLYDISVRTIHEDVPDLKIQDGNLVVNITDPIIIKPSDKSEFTMIIDNTGITTQHNVEKYGNSIALLKNDFVLTIDGQTESMSYDALGIDQLSRNDIQQFLDTVGSVKSAFFVVAFFIYYLCQVAGHLITITILALIGIIISNIRKQSINYGQSWKMSAYAITLSSVFFMIMNFFHAVVPFSSLINWSVMIIMLFLSMKEISKASIE